MSQHYLHSFQLLHPLITAIAENYNLICALTIRVLLILFLFSQNTNAQFDSVIFSKYMYLSTEYENIYALGDHNGDGYDDILIYDCEEKKATVFLGGDPMDTIPIIKMNVKLGSISVIDINDDGVKDIIILDMIKSNIQVYLGGSELDSIPSFEFYPPPGYGTFGGITTVLEDFNGDGRSEYVIWRANLPFSDKQYGILYFYNTGSDFDTIPHYAIKGDSVNKIFIDRIDTGDLNGDGKADFTTMVRIGDYPNYTWQRHFFLGNENWDLTADQVWYQEQQSFDLSYLKIIKDINGDGKDDILIRAYGNIYPFYYKSSILYGGFPVDTLQDVGLNTQNEVIDLNTPTIIPKAGDLNGDGYNDLFVKMIGTLYPNVKLWVGGRNMPYTSDDQANKTWYGNEAGFGRSIAAVGDVNGDGVNDIAICQIPYYNPNPCKLSQIYIFAGDTNVIGDTGTVNVAGEKELSDDYYLYDPYPNPFNPTTTIKFDLPKDGVVELGVYDILGRKITTLVNEYRSAGSYEQSFNASSIASGIYLYRIKVNDFVSAKKMIVVK